MNVYRVVIYEDDNDEGTAHACSDPVEFLGRHGGDRAIVWAAPVGPGQAPAALFQLVPDGNLGFTWIAAIPYQKRGR
jgi:hypothetical protein